MKTIVIYGGRFQPPHGGHKASFTALKEQFPDAEVYMTSADKEIGQDDPFTWDEKKKLAVFMGIPSNNFVKAKNAYSIQPLIDAGIPINDDTIVILAVSEKDKNRFGTNKSTDNKGFVLKKDGKRAAIQPLRNNPKPISQGHMYCTVTPTEEFTVNGEQVTGATQIRSMYRTGNDRQRQQILKDLYGSTPPKLKKLFDKRLKTVQTESFLREFIDFINRY